VCVKPARIIRVMPTRVEVVRHARSMPAAIWCVCALVAFGSSFPLADDQGRASPVREIAITIDDLPTASVLGNDLTRASRITDDLLATLMRHRVPAIGFVNERKLVTDGSLDERRVALLRRWIASGFELGNHTFSHVDFHHTSVSAYEQEVLQGERVTKRLLREAGRDIRYFRHPYLHTGRSAAARRTFEAFLAKRRYRVAPITVDNYDYLFAAAYDRAGARGDHNDQQKIVSAYIEYMEAVVAYYEQQSRAFLGREIRQTLLLHASALNAATFDRLAAMLHGRGYQFVALDRALEDRAYKSRDEYYGPAGITWLHRWALTAGKRGTFFAGEPPVPEWIEKASKDASGEGS
jgi:peptidoglycan/xylan/chitin deacetylase (PgdA/CDA1 family)